MPPFGRRPLLLLGLPLLGACDDPWSGRWYSDEQVQRGETVFEANCAECHAERARGADGWRQRLPDGTFPPPPLDGSGHAWHHPLAELRQIIWDGQRRMPGFGDELSEEDVDAVIA